MFTSEVRCIDAQLPCQNYHIYPWLSCYVWIFFMNYRCYEYIVDANVHMYRTYSNELSVLVYFHVILLLASKEMMMTKSDRAYGSLEAAWGNASSGKWQHDSLLGGKIRVK